LTFLSDNSVFADSLGNAGLAIFIAISLSARRAAVQVILLPGVSKEHIQKTEQGVRAAVIAGFLGWTLDAFDFFLVVFCLTSIGAEFHRTDQEIALSLTLTLAFRPIGALIFGTLADRYGRRLPLMLDLVFYSIVEVLTGLAPGYKSFLVLRALFGIGMGGEWGVGAALAMEKAPPKWRGVLSGLLQEGYAAGYLLAAVAYFFVFPHLGWRPLFFIGGVPALLALYVRWGVAESDVWKQSPRLSWRDWGNGIAKNWNLMIYLTILMAAMNFSSHGTQDLFPTFLQRDWKQGPQARAAITAISMVGAICGGVLFGLASDRIGRRKSMLIAFALAAMAIPLWAFSPTLGLLALGAFVMQFMVQGAWGVIPAHITELSPDHVRGFLPGFAYQCGVLFAGTISYIQARYASHHSYATAMAMTMWTVFAFAIVVIGMGREKRGIQFGETPRD
jgi:SHS family lactate transporter-like MFS transporter